MILNKNVSWKIAIPLGIVIQLIARGLGIRQGNFLIDILELSGELMVILGVVDLIVFIIKKIRNKKNGPRISFENTNKAQKIILSISFIIALPIILIGSIFIIDDGGWLPMIIGLAILALVTLVFCKLWADKK